MPVIGIIWALKYFKKIRGVLDPIAIINIIN